MKVTKKNILSHIKKLSSLDILGIFVIFFITASTYFFLSRRTEYLEVTIRLFNNEAPEQWIDTNQPKSWYIEQIKVGKAQRGTFGDTLAEIVDVYSYPNGYIYNDVYVTLRLKTAQNKITKQYIYEGSPLLIHDTKSFRIQDLLLSGEIIAINQKPAETKKATIIFELEQPGFGNSISNTSQAIIKGVDNYLAEIMQEGLLIRDSKNNEIVKVTKVIKKPGEILLATPGGLQKIIDQERTQVKFEAEVLVEKINNHFFYRKEESIIIDQRIYLTFEQATLIGKIIAIEM